MEALVVAAQGCVERLKEPGPLSPHQHSPTQGPLGQEEGALVGVLFPGVPELLQRVLAEDTYGQGQLGDVCGEP